MHRDSKRSAFDLEGEKYSLRPRSIAKRLEVEQKLKQLHSGGGLGGSGGGGNGAGGAVGHVKRTPKPKQKPAPLSKYRRKTANARERSRMREINQAFETLRKAIPQESTAYQSASPSPSSSSSSSSCGSTTSSEKWTKITTLRLAMDYIESLTRVLEHEHEDALISCSSAMSMGIVEDALDFGCSSLGSLASSGDLLSDDLDSFDDIPMSCVPDHCADMAFDIFLESDGDSLHFHSDLSDHQPNTP